MKDLTDSNEEHSGQIEELTKTIKAEKTKWSQLKHVTNIITVYTLITFSEIWRACRSNESEEQGFHQLFIID